MDPGTDFRGAGLLALECLLFLAQRQPALFDTLRHKRNGTRSEWEYPFAVGGVNLTFMLLGGLQIRLLCCESPCQSKCHASFTPAVQHKQWGVNCAVEICLRCTTFTHGDVGTIAGFCTLNTLCGAVQLMVFSHLRRGAGSAGRQPAAKDARWSTFPAPAGELQAEPLSSVLQI